MSFSCKVCTRLQYEGEEIHKLNIDGHSIELCETCYRELISHLHAASLDRGLGLVPGLEPVLN